MAEALSRDRLYPSLLDRLIDDEPGRATEARENRSATLQRLRENVLRDLNWLFNATQSSIDFDGDALLAGSVINYGMPPLAGRPASQYDLGELARVLREVILRFEPRIIAHTLKVTRRDATRATRTTCWAFASKASCGRSRSRSRSTCAPRSTSRAA